MKRIVFLLTFLLFGQLVSAECQKGRVRLQVLGSGGPELNDQRASSSYLIWLDEKAVLMVDAGSGSSHNFEKSGADINDLKAIAFTHFHVDHSADFPEYIKASFFTGRKETLAIYGPAGNEIMPSTTDFVNAMLNNAGAYPYLKDYLNPKGNRSYHIKPYDVKLSAKRKVFQIDKTLKLTATPVHHGPLAAVAWRVDVGGCAITFSGDMSNRFDVLKNLAKDSDILVAHNAIPEFTNRIARSLHMPPSEIGKIAKAAEVKKLILSHRMQRTLGVEKETLKQIQQYYQGDIELADDLSEYAL